MQYRLAPENDAAVRLALYSQYIETAITFECQLPSVEEFRQRIHDVLLFYPYLVAEDNGRIVGYAYAHRPMQREAYQWNAELSIYLDQKVTSKGIGTELACKIIALLKLQGIQKVCSGITQPNPKSDGLHAKLGFQLVGTYYNAGFKAGRWYDVSWFQKDIGEHQPQPQNPVALSTLAPERIERILNTTTR